MYETRWYQCEGTPSQALIFLHGRGQSHVATLSMARGFLPLDSVLALPCAPERQWYPGSFLAALQENEPKLSASIAYVDKVIEEITSSGIPGEKIVLSGFSQGAALAAEYVGRKGNVKALIAFSGGRIGPPGVNWEETESLFGIPMLFSGAMHDPFVPMERILETTDHFVRRGAVMQLETFDDEEHCVREAEYAAARALLGEAHGALHASEAG